MSQDDIQPVGERRIYKVVDGRELSLFIVKPSGWTAGDTRPAVVFYHGGGWTGGRPTQFNEHSKYLASRGLVCIQVEYRLLGKGAGSTPEMCIRDARSAMRWVRATAAAELGIDPGRIASGGGSAGGHLAAFVGMMDGMDDPQDDLSVSARSNAMLLFNPVFDNGPGGYGHNRVGADHPKYSPFHNISAGDPPSIVFLGDEDRLIPVATAAAFKQQMNAAGVRCEVMIFQGMGHAFFNYAQHDHIPYYQTVLACDAFLVDLGWLKGAPTLETGGADLNRVRSTMIRVATPPNPKPNPVEGGDPGSDCPARSGRLRHHGGVCDGSRTRPSAPGGIPCGAANPGCPLPLLWWQERGRMRTTIPS